ncbi:hypothetical protein [Croceibacter atlanticus]|uniref:ArnT family glycosyltransferase n=1 Tax=Croceibacter atlanticus TaxID=313588 RepID=UPI0030F6E91B
MNRITKFVFKNPELSIIAFAVVVRLITFIFYPNTTLFNDSENYLDLAKRLLEANLIGYEGYRTPGYSMLILLGFQNLCLVVLIQHLLGICTSLFMYWLLRSIALHKGVAIGAAILYSCLLHVVFFEKGILTETFSAFLLTAILYILQLHIIKRKFKPNHFGILSVSILLLVMTKPFFIYILPIIILFLGIALWSQLQFKIIKPILIITIPTLLAVGSWALLNKQNTGYATLSSYFGYNLAQQTVNFIHKAPDDYATVRNIYVEQIEKDKEQLGYTYYSIWDAYQPMMKATGYNFYDLSNELANMSKATIIANPKDYIKQVFLSWKLFWGVKLYWDQSHISNPAVVIVYKGIWFLQRPLIVFGKILFVGLFLWSFIKGVLRKRISVHLLSFIFALVILGSILQAAIIYSDNYRFSFPYLPAIIIVLASYSVRLTQLIRKKK